MLVPGGIPSLIRVRECVRGILSTKFSSKPRYSGLDFDYGCDWVRVRLGLGLELGLELGLGLGLGLGFRV